MREIEKRLIDIEDKLNLEPQRPCVLYHCQADGSDEEENRAAAVAGWELEHAEKLDLDRVQFICWRVFKMREEVEKYGGKQNFEARKAAGSKEGQGIRLLRLQG